MSRKPRFEALVVNAIRRLQAAQGSTASEIASYLSQEYDVGGPEVRKQIQQTIRRGVNYGILQKSKRLVLRCFDFSSFALEKYAFFPWQFNRHIFYSKRRHVRNSYHSRTTQSAFKILHRQICIFQRVISKTIHIKIPNSLTLVLTTSISPAEDT